MPDVRWFLPDMDVYFMRAAFAMSSTQTGTLLRQKRLNRKKSREKANVADYLKDLIVFPSAPWYGSAQSGAPAFGCRLPEVIRCLHGFLFARSVKTEFQHSQINDLGMSSLHNLYLPAKPDFAPNGNACACPNCGHSALYRRTDLLYRT
jgi:hypothetical protein